MGRLTRRLTSARGVSVLVAVPVLVLLLATTRTWLTGRSAEPLLGGGDVSATGSQLAPGVVALALVCLVALVSTLTGGRVVRRVSAMALLAAAAGAAALTLGPLTDPQTALGRVAAAGLGRTGVVRTTASASGWMWAALVSAVVLVPVAAVAVHSAGRWGGLSSRFEVPGDTSGRAVPGVSGGAAQAAPPGDAGAAGGRTAWDDLSEGSDPTVPSPGSPPPGDDERPT